MTDELEREALRLVEAGSRAYTAWVRYIEAPAGTPWGATDDDVDLYNRPLDLIMASRDILNQADVPKNHRAYARLRTWESLHYDNRVPGPHEVERTLSVVLEAYHEKREEEADEEG